MKKRKLCFECTLWEECDSYCEESATLPEPKINPNHALNQIRFENDSNNWRRSINFTGNNRKY